MKQSLRAYCCHTKSQINDPGVLFCKKKKNYTLDFKARSKRGGEDFLTRLYVNKRGLLKIATTETDARKKSDCKRKKSICKCSIHLSRHSADRWQIKTSMCSIVYAAADDLNLDCAKTFNKQDFTHFTSVALT